MAHPETFSYGPHELQKIHVYKAEDSPKDQDSLWVMYVPHLTWQDGFIISQPETDFVIDTSMAGHGEITPSSQTHSQQRNPSSPKLP
jgi:hypothetical protein